MNLAAIDLGSNSVLLTVVGRGGEVLHDECRVVGLGRGLGDGGAFAEDRMEAAMSALVSYAAVASRLGVEPGTVRAVTTSSARRADNAASFFERVRVRTGLVFRVISGDEEARLTWAGALSGLGVSGRVMVVDLGGGSTELAVGERGLDWRHSYEIGSVRLTERVLGAAVPPAERRDLGRLRDRCRAVFSAPRPSGRIDAVVGVAGSVTSIKAAELGLEAYNSAAVHGTVLTDATLAELEERLLGCDAEERRAIFACSPGRSDYLLAGATVLRAALDVAGLDRMYVSDRGLRYGVLGA